jgi:hypothetical protein
MAAKAVESCHAAINRCVLPETTSAERLLEYVDIGSVESCGRITDVASVTFEAAPSRARRVPSRGDTIVSTVRTYLRAVAFIDNPSADTRLLYRVCGPLTWACASPEVFLLLAALESLR